MKFEYLSNIADRRRSAFKIAGVIVRSSSLHPPGLSVVGWSPECPSVRSLNDVPSGLLGGDGGPVRGGLTRG